MLAVSLVERRPDTTSHFLSKDYITYPIPQDFYKFYFGRKSLNFAQIYFILPGYIVNYSRKLYLMLSSFTKILSIKWNKEILFGRHERSRSIVKFLELKYH